MKKFLLFLLLISCTTVSEKIDENVKKEEEKLNNLLNQTEETLKIEMGKPDKVNFKKGSKNRFYIYENKKFKIKCERIFEINPRNTVVGYTSKNCF
ncbi:MAG: hypothetical protein CL687_01215 [Candidatus Pelagibacter sp.]|nr:hypothetical protein [Candidatus Pelagibacter sp.]MAJ85577.1 hypothetical protein [Candidatus Pelagibacter sp.]